MSRLKQKWGITSDLQFWIIMVVFSLAGMSVIFVKRPIFAALGITSETSLWITIPLWVAVVFPSYQVLLLFWGTVFGQFRFFAAFQKKMLRRMRILPREELAA